MRSPNHLSYLLFTSALLLIVACAGSAGRASVPLTGGMKITQSVTIKRGGYSIEDMDGGRVQISGHNFVVDFRGARLEGARHAGQIDAHTGIGLHITDARNVTIKNADVSACQWGIVIERSANVTLLHCTVSHNADLPVGTVIDESGREPEDQHGGGILIRDSAACVVSRCRAQHQWDGIDVVRSHDNKITDSDFSYCGNWGLHLWNASRNAFQRNRAVWCTTGEGALFQALTGWQTYDAQAVGIDHNSNENLIADNDLRFGGDAIFIRANEGGLAPGIPVPPRNVSSRNILTGNDCSFSPNNAIEVDFSDDTTITNNNCSYSHYGMWLGYSRRCKIAGNLCINDSAKAIEIENGQADTFDSNVFGHDPPRPGQSLIYLRQNGRDKTPSGPYTFRNNVFYGVGENPIQRKDTPVSVSGDVSLDDGYRSGVSIKLFEPISEDGKPRALTGAPVFAIAPNSKPTIQPSLLVAGANITLRGTQLNGLNPPGANAACPAFVTVDGIPILPHSVTPDALTFAMPADFWDRPAKLEAAVRVFNGLTWSDPVTLRLRWPNDGRPRIESSTLTPSPTGDTLILTGTNVNARGLGVRLNGYAAQVVSASRNKLVVKIPAEVAKMPGNVRRFNIIIEREADGVSARAWPIACSVPPVAAR